MVDGALILGDFLLELGDSLGESERVAGENAVTHLQIGGAKSGGEGLIDFMIGELLGLAGVLGLLIGGGCGGEGSGGLPRLGVDE